MGNRISRLEGDVANSSTEVTFTTFRVQESDLKDRARVGRFNGDGD